MSQFGNLPAYTFYCFREARMDASVKTTIEQRLVETGEKERLKEHLRYGRKEGVGRSRMEHKGAGWDRDGTGSKEQEEPGGSRKNQEGSGG